jgi:hypothetical protein
MYGSRKHGLVYVVVARPPEDDYNIEQQQFGTYRYGLS